MCYICPFAVRHFVYRRRQDADLFDCPNASNAFRPAESFHVVYAFTP